MDNHLILIMMRMGRYTLFLEPILEFSEHIRPRRIKLETLADHPLVNAMWFNVIWLIAVIGQYNLLLLTAIVFLAHFCMIERRQLELRRWAFIALPGLLIDCLFSYSGIFIFKDGQILPLWYIFLWLAFSSTPARAFVFLNNRYFLAALVGAIAGPLSYLAGYKLGAIHYSLPLATMLLVLSVLWALLLPLFFYINNWLEDNFREAA